ncbi:hypothetical protein [Actinoplanes siamensis]|uniref:Uncharacterized protein n=1 Tax=Actinoplanes siamensis TaxID=1223317 RepID=A0A919N122_9ACTN|nr:hypothetical protein [Actinoplanes siamensis]GIF03360.1 hypothetical protein Asi03nite_08980 [Actinoplanes siamensis]
MCIGAFPLRIIFTAANAEVSTTAPAARVAIRLEPASWWPGLTAKHQATTTPPTITVAESSQNASDSRPVRPGSGWISMATMISPRPMAKQVDWTFPAMAVRVAGSRRSTAPDFCAPSSLITQR